MISLVILTPATWGQGKAAKKPAPQSQTLPIEPDDAVNGKEKFAKPYAEEEGEGDPYKQFPRADAEDGNCDASLMKRFYDTYRSDLCEVSIADSCIDLDWESLFWASTFGFGFAGGVVGRAGFQLSEMQRDFRQSMKDSARLDLEASANARARNEMIEAEKKYRSAKHKFDNRKRKLYFRKSYMKKAALKSTIYGGAVGIVAMAGQTIALGEIGKKANASIFPKNLDCSDEEKHPDFVKYVPVEPGTCSTPIYAYDHPKFEAFMELPADEMLKKVQSSKRLCGYVKSWIVEVDKRRAQAREKFKIHNVTCDHSTGAINFELDKKSDTSITKFKIERKPQTEEFSSFKFERHFGPVLDAAAKFDLAKTEDDIQLVKTEIYNQNTEEYEKPIATGDLDKYLEEKPDKAVEVFEPFRAMRRLSRNLARCCDLDPPTPPTAAEKANRNMRANVKERQELVEAYQTLCPSRWFPDGKAPRPVTPESKNGKTKSAR